MGLLRGRSYRMVNTFIASSPWWLITFIAIRPDFGHGNGRLSVRYSVAQASSSISARSAVFSRSNGSLATEEISVADEKAVAIVVGVDEPAGDVLLHVTG
jgi:hypothetical protein